MSLPGDARIVLDIPPPSHQERQGTVTAGFLGDDGEFADSRTFLLDADAEAEFNLLISKTVRRACGPQSSS